MEFWISSEADKLITKLISKLDIPIEDALNSHLKAIGYKNDEIDEFLIIFIIRDDEFSALGGEEVTKERRDKVYGANIRIDHPSFRHADETGRKRLIYEGIKKAVLLLGEKRRIKNLEPIIEYIEQQQ